MAANRPRVCLAAAGRSVTDGWLGGRGTAQHGRSLLAARAPRRDAAREGPRGTRPQLRRLGGAYRRPARRRAEPARCRTASPRAAARTPAQPPREWARRRRWLPVSLVESVPEANSAGTDRRDDAVAVVQRRFRLVDRTTASTVRSSIQSLHPHLHIAGAGSVRLIAE
jgi:hypothetical protein